MKRTVLFLLLASLFALTGCDFLRSLAGRPTSEDIERMKLEIIRMEQARETGFIADGTAAPEGFHCQDGFSRCP